MNNKITLSDFCSAVRDGGQPTRITITCHGNSVDFLWRTSTQRYESVNDGTHISDIWDFEELVIDSLITY